MKRFKLYFRIGNKKLKATIFAENELAAKDQFFKSIKFDKVTEENLNAKDLADEFMKTFNDIFNDKK